MTLLFRLLRCKINEPSGCCKHPPALTTTPLWLDLIQPKSWERPSSICKGIKRQHREKELCGM